MLDRILTAWIWACLIGLLIVGGLALAPSADAQTIVGGTGGATMIISGGDVKNVGTIVGEVEYQFPWGSETDIESKHWGGLVGFIGLNTEGGGEVPGLGYRHYIKTGGVYPGFGISAFALGEDTPEIGELTIFTGIEGILEVPASEEGGDRVTAFLGIYPSIAGMSDVTVVRAGIRAALN